MHSCTARDQFVNVDLRLGPCARCVRGGAGEKLRPRDDHSWSKFQSFDPLPSLSLSVALPLSLLSLFAQPMAAAACAAPVGLAPRRPLLAIAFRGWTQGRRAGPREQ